MTCVLWPEPRGLVDDALLTPCSDPDELTRLFPLLARALQGCDAVAHLAEGMPTEPVGPVSPQLQQLVEDAQRVVRTTRKYGVNNVAFRGCVTRGTNHRKISNCGAMHIDQYRIETIYDDLVKRICFLFSSMDSACLLITLIDAHSEGEGMFHF